MRTERHSSSWRCRTRSVQGERILVVIQTGGLDRLQHRDRVRRAQEAAQDRQVTPRPQILLPAHLTRSVAIESEWQKKVGEARPPLESQR